MEQYKGEFKLNNFSFIFYNHLLKPFNFRVDSVMSNFFPESIPKIVETSGNVSKSQRIQLKV